ncbi:3-hydroxyacyl-CoA dehydrogenase [Burkholderia cepacia]|uniref:3-hydroxyacyl-CoA dehydrogenase family protein n=1 Tax=Burkholderia TaxID=32008 RepID=UPI000756ECF2|nr:MULTISPECIES: 3-hydroxyacyl-CoA dehydrogenase family protein [Burkholderia]KVA53016.1 3-hydroxyacyl-CoA dehydrogenase [Burkholderia cepacia]KVA61533.1 3-hydroxyacyl-CoA dehydrogenase [Burkholderia cepacia]KVA65019.1 3-hydroxyacyl-CoA dehydrogenase [Burkholderia cepacia]KVA87277.1 3-hydroxyacyl-CoA dehydrogenase [Burkholderia cepacia]KVA89429.1 3-hydroxyacyl-CoA dehydrogenase [Burkholderia cepacia]
MSYQIIESGESRSFHGGHAFVEAARDDATARVYIGSDAGRAFMRDKEGGWQPAGAPFVLLELGHECLAVHSGDSASTDQCGGAAPNVFGFARFRLGDAEPSRLIELVKPAQPDEAALAHAKRAFEDAGFVVAVCGDFPGRIVDRLVRPYYNAALRRLDEKLATASDLDTTLRLGLGYPEGPIALLERTGLEHHYRATQALYEALGDSAYAPARRARVAHQRADGGAR